MSIVEDGKRHGRLVGAKWRSQFSPDVRVGRVNERRVNATIRTALAGDVAVCLLVGKHRNLGAQGDFDNARSLAGRVCGTEDEVSALVELLRISTRNELSQPWNWAAVKALAESLLERGTIGVRRAKRVIEAAIAANDG